MALIFKKTSSGKELIGETRLPPKAQGEKPSRIKDASGRKAVSTKKRTAKQTPRKTAIRMLESARMQELAERTETALSIKVLHARNPRAAILRLKVDLKKQIAYSARQEKESLRIKDKARYRRSISLLLAHLAKLENYEITLDRDEVDHRGAVVKGAINRRLTAKVVKKHPLGRIVGRSNVVEYKAPGSTLWATLRKVRK